MANQTSFSVLRAPLALLGVLATTFAGPWVAFPASHVLHSPVTTFIFVAPQIVFPYTSLVRYHETGNKAVFSESLALDGSSVNNYTSEISSILYFHRKTTGAAFSSRMYWRRRSASSDLLATRSSRSIDRVSLLKKTSIRFSQDP